MLHQLSPCSRSARDSSLPSSAADFAEQRLIRMSHNGRAFPVFGLGPPYFGALANLTSSVSLSFPVFIFPPLEVLGWAPAVSPLSTDTPSRLGWLWCSWDWEAWVMCTGFSEALTAYGILFQPPSLWDYFASLTLTWWGFPPRTGTCCWKLRAYFVRRVLQNSLLSQNKDLLR